MNFTQVAGHLGADPEERFTPAGQKVVTLRLASHSRKGGKDLTIWWRVTIWGDRFDKMMPYLKKGSPVLVMGEMMKPEIYTNKEGQPQIALEIHASDLRFSPFGRSDKAGGHEASSTPSMAIAETGSSPFENVESNEDEIPF